MIHCTKKEVSIKDLSSKCDQVCSYVRIWSNLLDKSLMENFIFCAAILPVYLWSKIEKKIDEIYNPAQVDLPQV